MDLILQIWGGGFYLSNKMLLAFAEKKRGEIQRRLKIFAWLAYLIGVPAWVVILLGKHDWIAASIEAGGVPAMLLGLYNAYHQHQRMNLRFNRFVSACTYLSLLAGVSISLYHHQGLNSLSQLLELGVMLGFLMGSYLMAHNNPRGWLFFMLMNLSMAALMLLQAKLVLMVQQLISLAFVVYGYVHAGKAR